MIDKTVTALSEKIAREYHSSDTGITSIDPAMVLIISQIILEVLKLINSCRKTRADVLSMCNKTNALQVGLLKTIVKKRLPEDQKDMTSRLVDAIIVTGGHVSEEEVAHLMQS